MTSQTCSRCRAPFLPELSSHRLCPRCVEPDAGTVGFRTIADALPDTIIVRLAALR